MSKIKYLNINGLYTREDDNIFSSQNRAFRYGDAIFETMLATNGKVAFFYDHIERLILGMKILNFDIPTRLTVDTKGFHNEVIKLLSKNKIFKAARIRLTFFRKNGGTYLPKTNEVEYIIEAAALNYSGYLLNNKGLVIDIFDQITKPVNPLAMFKTANSLLYILAANHAWKYRLDDVLLQNDKKNIIEATSSNLFVVKNNTIYTPDLSQGCVAGIMRKQIIKICKKQQLKINHECQLKLNHIETADEIFLTNAAVGIKWVAAFRNRRFFHKTSSQLIELLNQEIYNNQ